MIFLIVAQNLLVCVSDVATEVVFQTLSVFQRCKMQVYAI